MPAVSHLLKINLRARNRNNISRLIKDVLGGELIDDRGNDTIGQFEACTFQLAGVMFDVVIPEDPDTPLGRVIDKHGEGIDSICFAVDDMDETKAQLASNGIAFSNESNFKNNRVGFVHPRDACGIGLEFVEGPLAE